MRQNKCSVTKLQAMSFTRKGKFLFFFCHRTTDQRIITRILFYKIITVMKKKNERAIFSKYFAGCTSCKAIIFSMLLQKTARTTKEDINASYDQALFIYETSYTYGSVQTMPEHTDFLNENFWNRCFISFNSYVTNLSIHLSHMT